jgi:hypothetical protein
MPSDTPFRHVEDRPMTMACGNPLCQHEKRCQTLGSCTAARCLAVLDAELRELRAENGRLQAAVQRLQTENIQLADPALQRY